MRILLWWLSVGLGVVFGHAGLGPWAGPSLARDLGVGLLAAGLLLGGAAAVVASVAQGRGRWPGIVALGAIVLARGALAFADEDPARWTGPRGAAAGIRTLEVEGASHPGGRCRVRVRSAGVSLWLDAPPQACPLAQGQHVRVLAERLHRHATPELPGDPSPAALARSRGAVALATVDRVWPAGGEPSAYWGWVARQRQRAWELTRGDRAASFVVASSLGVRSALAPADRNALRRAGLGHLIAVSGLHVGLAAWALLMLSTRIGARFGRVRSLGVLGSWLPLVAYVLLTGASPPAVRAGVMAMGVGLGAVLGRPHHGPMLLCVTSVLMLIVRPAWASDPGFQLSVVAMASLVRAPAAESMVRQTWRVTWVVLPLSLWHFGHAGVWGVVSNLVAVPVFTLWILPWALVGWWLVPWLGGVALAPARGGAQLVLDVAGVVAGWPSPPAWAVAVTAVLALVLGLRVGRRDAHGRLRRLGAWLPSAPLSLAVVTAVVWPRPVLAPAGLRWWVAGSSRAPAVVTVSAEDPQRGCIHEVALSAGRWRGLLDAMGLREVGPPLVREEGDDRDWPTAPHEHELRQMLRAQRRWAEDPVACASPPPPAVQPRWLDACRRRAGTRHALVAGAAEGTMCFVAGHWERLDSGLLDSAATEVSP
ncbi:MAG: ComEC/Rec2 family competence protein [Nannocystaceae bacterium]